MYLVDDITQVGTSSNLQAIHEEDVLFFGTNSSRASMSTLASDEVLGYFRSINGHTYEADERVPLTFPTDSQKDRLSVVSHIMTRLSYDGTNIPHEADTLLRENSRDNVQGQVRVLDLVTNSGSWVREMAETYPTIDFVSVDSKPLIPHEPHPRIRFEVYDFFAEIRNSDASFDLVHIRDGVYATKDFNRLLREIYRVLKPGGIIVITEVPLALYEASNPLQSLDGESQQSAALLHFRGALEGQGIDLSIWDDLSQRLSPEHSLWQNPPIPPDSGRTSPLRGFHSIVQEERLLPDGPWSTNETERIVGGLARLVLMHTWAGFTPLLVLSGWREAEAQELVNKALEDLRGDRHQAYAKCHRWLMSSDFGVLGGLILQKNEAASAVPVCCLGAKLVDLSHTSRYLAKTHSPVFATWR